MASFRHIGLWARIHSRTNFKLTLVRGFTKCKRKHVKYGLPLPANMVECERRLWPRFYRNSVVQIFMYWSAPPAMAHTFRAVTLGFAMRRLAGCWTPCGRLAPARISESSILADYWRSTQSNLYITNSRRLWTTFIMNEFRYEPVLSVYYGKSEHESWLSV